MGEEEKVKELIESVKLAAEELRESSRLLQAAAQAAALAQRAGRAGAGPAIRARFIEAVAKARDAMAAAAARRPREEDDIQRALDAADDILIGRYSLPPKDLLTAIRESEAAAAFEAERAIDLEVLRRFAQYEGTAPIVWSSFKNGMEAKVGEITLRAFPATSWAFSVGPDG